MKDNSISIWEAGNEVEMSNALDVLYEMAVGYVLGELRDEHPASYEKLTLRNRSMTKLINNVRYSIDITLAEVIDAYGDEPFEDCDEK